MPEMGQWIWHKYYIHLNLCPIFADCKYLDTTGQSLFELANLLLMCKCQSYWIQTIQTGDQLHSDKSPMKNVLFTKPR